MRIEDILRTKQEFLFRFPNVIGCSPGTKIKNGRDTGKECITIFVSRKVPEIQLSADAVLPKVIDRVETDVVEVGEVRIQPISAIEVAIDNRLKHRPVLGGISVSPQKFLLAGTSGLIVMREGKPFILSNNHVLRLSQIYNPDDRPQKGDYIRQPSFVDGGKPEDG